MKQLAVKTVTLVLLCTFLQTFATSFDAPQHERASGINRPANDAAKGRSYYCQYMKFNPRTQVCCFGHIYHKAHGQATQCCRRGVYNYYTMKCCRGNPIPKNYYCQDEPRRYTCGNTYYTNPNAVVCCSGNLLKRIYGAHTSCCRQGVYDTRSQKCCFNAWNQLPVYQNIYGVHTRCCLNGVYDYRVQTCCYGRVLKRGIPCRTCGGRPHPDPVAYICCNRTVLKHKSHGFYTKCCGEAVYNRLTQFCCSGRVLHQSSTTRCCGSEVYNIKTHICCWGTVKKREHGMFSRCCRHGNRYTVYHYGSHLCCNGAAAPRAGSSAAMCCGQQTYNSMMAKCCPDNRVVMKCGKCK